MAYETIFGAVDQSIEELCKEFHSRPTPFYTEHDMVSFFTHPATYALGADGSAREF
jgi:hypothetical protein